MTISSNFDGGNIHCISINDSGEIKVKIEKDNKSDFHQWFYFKLSQAKDVSCEIEIVNASETSYSNAWHNYNAVASYDRKIWFRVKSTYNDTLKLIPLDIAKANKLLAEAGWVDTDEDNIRDIIDLKTKQEKLGSQENVSDMH